jgi:hypothetical protein
MNVTRHLRVSSLARADVFAALAAVAAAAFLSCSDSGTTLGPNRSDLKGSVIVRVQDANTREPVAGAAVSLVGGPEGTTGDDGKVTFPDVPSGTYFVRTAKGGYETGEEALESTVKGELTPVPVLVSRTISLYKSGAVVKGRLLLRPNKGKEPIKSPGAVTVEMRLTGAFAKALRTAVTTASGDFSFDSLPELSTYALRVPEFTVDGKRYRLTVPTPVSAVLYAGEQFTMPVTVLDPVASSALQLLSLTSAKLEKGKPLSVEFATPVDTSALAAGSILLAANGANIAAEVSWSSDLTVLAVKPYQADWAEASSYTLTLTSLVDNQGGPLRGPQGESYVVISATIASPASNPAKIANLRLRANLYLPNIGSVDTGVVDYLTSSYRLLWSKDSGALGYDVYTREAQDSAWKQVAAFVTDTQFNISAYNRPLSKGPLRQHMVVPKGDKASTSFDGAAALMVEDGVKPTLSTSSPVTLLSGLGFSNLGGSAKRTVELSVSLRSYSSGTLEPLDTSKAPDIRVGEGCNGFGSCDSTYAPKLLGFAWTSRTTAKVQMEVEAGKDGRRDSLVIDFSKVADLNGNVFDTLPNAPVLKFLTY